MHREATQWFRETNFGCTDLNFGFVRDHQGDAPSMRGVDHVFEAQIDGSLDGSGGGLCRGLVGELAGLPAGGTPLGFQQVQVDRGL